jgi:hypothetical protein
MRPAGREAGPRRDATGRESPAPRPISRLPNKGEFGWYATWNGRNTAGSLVVIMFRRIECADRPFGAPTRTIQLSVHQERGEMTERYDRAAGAIEQTAADYLPYRFARAAGGRGAGRKGDDLANGVVG